MNEFLENINNHTEQEIISNMPAIKQHFRYIHWSLKKEYFKEIFKIVNQNKVLYELFKNEEKFSLWKEKLDFPEKLKFGLEIEVANMPFDEIQCIFETNAITTIMEILKVPTNIAKAIIQNSDFQKKNEFNKWIFSPEACMDSSEASTPIMTNNVLDLNQIVAICTLLKALNAKLNGGTGLHINIGVNYLECNAKAIENLLKLWAECEELFFKMANPEGEIIRIEAHNMAVPIKENIQRFLEEDGSVTLNTEEDMEKFLYQIQARNRMDNIVAWTNFGWENNVESDLRYAETEEERFAIYHRYNEGMKQKTNEDDKTRWTSINFNHMKWNDEEPGRIEIRIFDSSLEPEIIFEDLVFVGKILEVSLEKAKNPNYKEQQWKELFVRNVKEERKVDNLLNLLFDEPKQKDIFKNRWQSVKREKEYLRYISGTDTFERE